MGRNEAIRRARSTLFQTGLVVLAGASGVGKTALARAVTDDKELDSQPVTRIRGTYGLRSIPFAALARLRLPQLPPDDDGLAAHALSLLSTIDDGRRVLVDDAHLLDEASAAVVAELARSDVTETVLTVTTGEPVPADIVGLWAERPECRVDLEPLSRDEVAEMVGNLLGRDAEDGVVDQIAQITLGYPLYIAALVAEMEQTGTDALSPRSSDRLVSLFERRLGRLGREERRLFDLVAFAESLPLKGVTDDRDVEALGGLEKSGLVEVELGHVRVTHPLLAAVARSTLTREGMRSCATRLVDAICSDMEESDVAALVRRALAVGVVAKADHLEIAARLALRLHDFEGAASITAHRPEEPALVAIRATAIRYLGEVPDSVPINLDDDSLTEFLSARSQALAFGEGRYNDAIDLLRRGLSQLDQPANRDRIAMELMILSGLTADVEALLGASLLISTEVDADTRLLAIASTLLGEALTLSTASSDDTYRAGGAVVELDDPDSFLVERLEMSNGLAQVAEGRLAEARAILEGDERGLEGSWRTVGSVIADAWLPIDEARSLAVSAVESLEESDPLGNLSLAQRMAELRGCQRGDLANVDIQSRPLGSDLSRTDSLMRKRSEAWAVWHERPDEGADRLVELGRESVSLGHRLWGLLAFLDAARLGRGSEVVADVEHLVISRGVGLAVLTSKYARATSADHLWDCAQMWWQKGAPTYAIEAALRAARDPSPLFASGVQILSLLGAVPVVGDTAVMDKPLSERQVEIVVGVVTGETNESLAESLFLSRRTIENHLYRIYQALQLQDGRHGLIDRLGWIGV